ncbi:MAG TPA: hypothetical protein PLY51_11125, partial [Microthrixaceae bacterium]|nr:hypothetical protein [Microthrixaceae bacterium]
MPADAASPRLLGGAAAGSDALVLGIETSCDETAAACVRGGTDVLSSVVSSQVDLHAKYGGVVPEIASRAHNELIIPVVARAMVEAGVDGRRIDAVAATTGPGLIGALLVGVSAAKALALTWDVPFVSVNHLEAHLYAALLEDPHLKAVGFFQRLEHPTEGTLVTLRPPSRWSRTPPEVRLPPPH